ncbi:unnamed protein product [Thlaspi arvense]|uniref:Uncharacterized protein n=1 Tax=Thlaspi arvense TaxID=13288 RepID=A0AAU9T300_THLAR|nr:unnamed protein product [Thlaspi arvense]
MSRGCCHPDCIRAMNAQEEHDASERAAIVAANLISSARVILKLDSEFTEYSAQFLVDNAGPKKEEMDQQPVTVKDCVDYLRDISRPKEETGQGETVQPRPELTVKDCIECALKLGMPRMEHWGHLGCVFKVPPFAFLMPRIPPMKGEVVEAKKLEEAFELLRQQPVGAKLHVFSPQIDRVGEGVYDGPAGGGRGTHYVGLRDVIIVSVEKADGDAVAVVKICYKKKTSFMKVSLCRMFVALPSAGQESKVTEPTGLLVDFIIPRLSK